MKRGLWVGIFAIIVILFFMFVAYYAQERVYEEIPHERKEAEKTLELTPEQRAQKGIKLHTVTHQNLERTLKLSGLVSFDPNHVAIISPKAEGVIQASVADVGQKVQPGDLLVELWSSDLLETQGEYFAKKKQLELADLQYEGEQKLFEKGLSSPKEKMQSECARQDCFLSCSAAKQKLLACGMKEEELEGAPFVDGKYRIYATIQGDIVQKQATLGEVVPTDKTLFMLADLDYVMADFELFPKVLSQIKAGQKIFINDLENKSSQEATVHWIALESEPESVHAHAKVLLDNTAREFWPGMFVKGDLVVEEKNALAVPKGSVKKVDGHDVVFVVQGNKIEARNVELGSQDNHWIEVTFGLQENETVVTGDVFLVKAALLVDEAGQDD